MRNFETNLQPGGVYLLRNAQDRKTYVLDSITDSGKCLIRSEDGEDLFEGPQSSLVSPVKFF